MFSGKTTSLIVIMYLNLIVTKNYVLNLVKIEGMII